jgi:hypothetical protein
MDLRPVKGCLELHQLTKRHKGKAAQKMRQSAQHRNKLHPAGVSEQDLNCQCSNNT